MKICAIVLTSCRRCPYKDEDVELDQYDKIIAVSYCDIEKKPLLNAYMFKLPDWCPYPDDTLDYTPEKKQDMSGVIEYAKKSTGSY